MRDQTQKRVFSLASHVQTQNSSQVAAPFSYRTGKHYYRSVEKQSFIREYCNLHEYRCITVQLFNFLVFFFKLSVIDHL